MIVCEHGAVILLQTLACKYVESLGSRHAASFKDQEPQAFETKWDGGACPGGSRERLGELTGR